MEYLNKKYPELSQLRAAPSTAQFRETLSNNGMTFFPLFLCVALRSEADRDLGGLLVQVSLYKAGVEICASGWVFAGNHQRRYTYTHDEFRLHFIHFVLHNIQAFRILCEVDQWIMHNFPTVVCETECTE